VDFLKVDIEGFEFDLFSGDIGWVRNVEKIAMEVHPDYGDVSALKSTLEKAGFRVWLLDGNRKRVTQLRESSGYVFAKWVESEANRLAASDWQLRASAANLAQVVSNSTTSRS
jgi:hypothetical protein